MRPLNPSVPEGTWPGGQTLDFHGENGLQSKEAWKFDQEVALAVAINTAFALKVSHTLRYSAEPPEGFETTDTVMAVSLVAKLKR